jgi:membrane associated rhomboid family serine protease
MFFFGKYVETHFAELGKHEFFLVLYLAGIVISSLPSFLKNRHNSYYRALGASGGVSAVLFSFVYLAPWATITIWFIPCPAIIAGVAYLAYSAYMSGKGRDNVGHDAHFWCSVNGIVFTFDNDPYHGQNFIMQLMQPHFSF